MINWRLRLPEDDVDRIIRTVDMYFSLENPPVGEDMGRYIYMRLYGEYTTPTTGYGDYDLAMLAIKCIRLDIRKHSDIKRVLCQGNPFLQGCSVDYPKRVNYNLSVDERREQTKKEIEDLVTGIFETPAEFDVFNERRSIDDYRS